MGIPFSRAFVMMKGRWGEVVCGSADQTMMNDRRMTEHALTQRIEKGVVLIAGRMMAPRGNVGSHERQRGRPKLPNRKIAKGFLTVTGRFDLRASAINRFVPRNALETRKIAALNRLKKRVLETVRCIHALAFCITLHAGSTLHLADGLIGFAGFTTRNVASGGDGQNTAITNVGLEHTLPMAMQFVVGVHNFDFRCQKFFRRWCQGVFGHG